MLFVFTFLLQFCIALGNGPGVAGEDYVLNFDSPVYTCADEESQSFVDTSKIEMKRYNETMSYMTGIITFLKNFPPTTMVDVIIDKEMGGPFERFMSHEICDVCKEFKDPKSNYRDYFKQLGFLLECPFKANEYHVKEFIAIAKDLSLSSATVGRYQITINISKTDVGDCFSNKTFLACFKFDCIVEPL